MHDVFKNKGILFIIKFLGLFALLYGFNFFYMGVVAPGGFTYSPFLSHHFNYIAWWRWLLLHSSNIIAHLFGLNSYVEEPFFLRAYQGAGVRMVYSCIGYGVTFFWLAFVLANDGPVKKRLLWTVAGIAGIFIINAFRVALLLLAVQNKWNVNGLMDHHTMFNIAAYILIFIMIYFFTRKPTGKPVLPTPVQ